MPRFSLSNWIEGAVQALEILLRFGVVTGAGIAAALGQFVLAVVLLFVATGLFLRMWRLRRRRSREQ